MIEPWVILVSITSALTVIAYAFVAWEVYKWLRRRRNSRARTGLFEQVPEGSWSPLGRPVDERQAKLDMERFYSKREIERCPALLMSGEHDWEIGGTCSHCDAVVDPFD